MRPTTITALVLLGLAALCCLAALHHRRRRRRADARRQRFLDQAANAADGAAAKDLAGVAPTAAEAATQSPLAPFLAKALDRALPPPEGRLQAVAWTHDEMRDLAFRVVQRVNNRSPDPLGLSLVAFDRVSKTVDDATGILRYQFDAQVHAARRDTSARVTVKVDVDGDREYVRDIAVHGARLDVSAVRGTGGSADGHVEYARYEPVVRYDPQPV